MGQTRWQQLSAAWLSLSSCPAASGPADSVAAVVWSRAGQILTPLLAQVGFAARIAAALVLMREVEAISALPQQRQPEMAPGDVEEVDFGDKAL